MISHLVKQTYCDDKIMVFDNFITEEEREFLYSFVKNFDYEGLQDYKMPYFNKRQISDKAMSYQPGYENVMDKVRPELEIIKNRLYDVLNKFYKEEDWILGQHVFMKIFPDCIPDGHYISKDEGMFIHVDDQPWMESKVIFGSVIYLNDDYVGGELFYPDYDHYHRPKSRSLVLHAGDIKHGVKAVTEGERHAVTALVRIKGNYNVPLPWKEANPEGPYTYPPGYYGKRMPDDPIQGDIKVLRSDGTHAEYNSNPVLGGARLDQTPIIKNGQSTL